MWITASEREQPVDSYGLYMPELRIETRYLRIRNDPFSEENCNGVITLGVLKKPRNRNKYSNFFSLNIPVDSPSL